MNPKLIKFIELCLVDGVISDKEREVIFRKSKDFGVPEDECEIILEGMIQKLGKKQSSDQKSLNKESLEEIKSNTSTKDNDNHSEISHDKQDELVSKQEPIPVELSEDDNVKENIEINQGEKVRKTEEIKIKIKILESKIVNTKTKTFSSKNFKLIDKSQINTIISDCNLTDADESYHPGFSEHVLKSQDCYFENYTNWIISERGNILFLFRDKYRWTGINMFETESRQSDSIKIFENKSFLKKTYSINYQSVDSFGFNNTYIGLSTENKNQISDFLNNFLKFNNEFVTLKNELENLEDSLIEEKRLNDLKISQSNVLSELDKDGNGEVDVIEGNDDFIKLFRKHQKSIVEIDKNFVQQFVKISSYLKTKEKNIQSIFNSIKNTPNQEVLNEYVEILKGDIHSYNLILFNSLNMIVSLVEDEMITFYEIHEQFDTLNMFDSKHEKDISQKLSDIGDGLENLIYEIRDMSDSINNSIGELSYVTEDSNRQLTERLSEINSSIGVNNFLTGIQTYQMYKINKNTKSLRG